MFRLVLTPCREFTRAVFVAALQMCSH